MNLGTRGLRSLTRARVTFKGRSEFLSWKSKKMGKTLGCISTYFGLEKNVEFVTVVLHCSSGVWGAVGCFNYNMRFSNCVLVHTLLNASLDTVTVVFKLSRLHFLITYTSNNRCLSGISSRYYYKHGMKSHACLASCFYNKISGKLNL